MKPVPELPGEDTEVVSYLAEVPAALQEPVPELPGEGHAHVVAGGDPLGYLHLTKYVSSHNAFFWVMKALDSLSTVKLVGNKLILISS